MDKHTDFRKSRKLEHDSVAASNMDKYSDVMQHKHTNKSAATQQRGDLQNCPPRNVEGGINVKAGIFEAGQQVGDQQVSGAQNKRNRILVVTAVDAEREAVLRGIGDAAQIGAKQSNASLFDVFAAGAGPVAAAVRTARTLALSRSYSLVISAGIGGAYPGTAELGSVVIATDIVASDLGVETLDGFQSIAELGFGRNRIQPDLQLAAKLADALSAVGLPVAQGPIMTVSTATGTAETARARAERHPGVIGEAMEGFGVGTAAFDAELPVLEIRTVSNFVGPRDRDAWRIPEALQTLTKTFSILQEVL